MMKGRTMPAPNHDEIEKTDRNGQGQLRAKPGMIGNERRQACSKNGYGNADDAHMQRHMGGETCRHKTRERTCPGEEQQEES